MKLLTCRWGSHDANKSEKIAYLCFLENTEVVSFSYWSLEWSLSDQEEASCTKRPGTSGENERTITFWRGWNEDCFCTFCWSIWSFFLMKHSQFILRRFILLHLNTTSDKNVQLNARFKAFRLLNPAAPSLTWPSPCNVHPLRPIWEGKALD